MNPYSLRNFPFVKRIILDIHVQDLAKRSYAIEMQATPARVFADRMLYDWAKTYEGQAPRGADIAKATGLSSEEIKQL